MENLSFSNKFHAARIHFPRWEELPNVELYMDQVVAFINSEVGGFVSHIGGTTLTKSMVNNYVKAKIVQAPVNKKYNRLSLSMIIVVYILKSCFSTEEIKKLIEMGRELPDHSKTYDRFCEALESALNSVFSGQIHVEDAAQPGRERKYLMDNFALAVACKAYIHRSFILGEI